MRNLSSNALAKIATDKGIEPINIIEVQWTEGGSRIAYADRDIGTSVRGRILSISTMETTIDVSGGSDIQTLSVVMSDTDGALKAIFDANDIHRQPVWVYQWFDGLDLTDRFLLFRGEINSPIEWSERDRTLKFDVVTKVEDREVGFAAEEGQFAQIPDELIGRPWPIIFGTVLDVPVLRLTSTVTGTTQEGVGIVSGKNLHIATTYLAGGDASDISFGQSLAVSVTQQSVLLDASHSWIGIDESKRSLLLDQANNVGASIANAVAAREQAQTSVLEKRQADATRFNSQSVLGPSTIHILGGEDFPQGVPVEVEIGNGGFFTGTFNCQEFRITSRRHPENEEKAQEAFDSSQAVDQQLIPNQPFEATAEGAFGPITRSGIALGGVATRSEAIDQVAQHYWADAGSPVRLVSDLDMHYIVSIVPGTIKAVRAYKKFEGIRRLVNVPTDLWEQVNQTYGTLQVVMVRLERQLSGIPDQGWEDEIYVTFESSVGPNTVDIMQYIVEQWSDLDVDAVSFAAVKTKLTPFPSNFAVLEQKQVLTLLREIAFQARCALFVKDNTVYLKYLPAEPSSDATVDASDIENDPSVSITLTSTEELVTKMVVTWRPTYADDDLRKMIFRNNIDKYGLQEREYEWYIYNQPDIIRKAATFWLIRLSQTWKKITFRTALNLLNLETFDCVTFDVAGTVSSGPVKTLIEKAQFDSDNRRIEFQCWTPVLAGTMSKYQFAWPEVAEGTFGNQDTPSVIGTLPVGSIEIEGDCPDGGGVIVGGPNIAFVGPADRGDPKPADTGFTAQPIIFPTTDFNLTASPNPNPNMRLTYAIDIPFPKLPDMPAAFGVDIRTTPIFDSDNPERGSRTLRDIIREIGEDGLALDTQAKFSDGTEVTAFDFKFDPEGEKFGAGTAFLKDD